MKRVLVWAFLGLCGGWSSLLLGAEPPVAEPADSAEEEGTDKDATVEEWEVEGGEDDFSSLFDDTHGIGFGWTSASLPGLMLYYDYNQPRWIFDDKRAQFHYQLAMLKGADDDTNKTKVAAVKQTQLTASVRLLNVKGVFVGAGLGVQETSLTYEPTGYDHQASSIFGLLEGGWQGDDGFYFQFGIRPAFPVTKSPKINDSIIPEANGHRNIAHRLWRQSQEFSGYIIGFGWYVL